MLWRNSKKCVVSKNSCSKNFINFQEKHRWNCFFKQSCRLPDTYWECSSGKFMKFSEQLSREKPANAGFCNYLLLKNVSTKIYFSKNVSFDFSHLCFDVQWHVFPGIKFATDVQELNIWIMEVSHMKIYSVL